MTQDEAEVEHDHERAEDGRGTYRGPPAAFDFVIAHVGHILALAHSAFD